MRGLARAVGMASIVLGVVSAMALPAGAAGKVGPKQYFTGVINGKDGNTSIPITIRMACAGAVRPGQTGHPMGGQTLAVHQLFPPSPTGSLGYTGNDSEIGVFFNAPPPARSRARAATTSTTFTRYDRTQPLPTSLTLPCEGTRTVWFVPIAVVPPSRAATVPVRFVGQP
jgi:hypothetical protein